MIRKVLQVLLGLNILGIGIGIMVKVGLGTDAVNVAYTGFASTYGLTIGQITTIGNVLLLVMSFIVDKSKIGLGTVMCVLLMQYSIDFTHDMMFVPDTLIFQLLWFMISQFVIGIGAAIIYEARAGLSIYDAFVFGLSDYFHTSYVYVRYVVDGIFLVLGFVYNGSFGIGTIIAFFVLGIIIDKSIKFVKQLKVFSL